MARASTVTLLALDRFAKILGINPMHFNGGIAPSGAMPLYSNACSDIWFQHPWQQSDGVSREELAQEIAAAEAEIVEVLGYWVAPVWIEEENVRYPQYHRQEFVSYDMKDSRGFGKSVRTLKDRVISPGRRVISPVSDGIVKYSVEYTDEDSDGYRETATVVVVTAVTNVKEIKIYYPDECGDPSWEIRPYRTKRLSGGTFTATFWSWQLFTPGELEELPTSPDGLTAIDADDPDSYLEEVDVYREYNDTTKTSAQLLWEPVCPTAMTCVNCGGAGCYLCQLTVQNGCFHIADARSGIVVPMPAAYNSDVGVWDIVSQAVCRDPDTVNLWYRCGIVSQDYISGRSHDPLSDHLARIIAMLAVTRLERALCSCSNATALAQAWQEDLASYGGGAGYMVDRTQLNNPFGTRRGEMDAWQKLKYLLPKRAKVATV